MRVIAPGLAVFVSIVAPLFAEDAPKPVKPAVNTVCPVDGGKVDARIPAIAGKTKEGKTVMIGACSEGCAAKIREKPEAYADDAVANRKHAETK